MMRKKIIRLVRKNGACARLSELEACRSDMEAVALLFRHWDFVRERQFLFKTLLREYKHRLCDYGVFIDDPDAPIAGREKAALFDSATTIEALGFNSYIIYAAGSSTLRIAAKDHALLVIDASGMTEVEVAASDKCSVVITLHDKASLQADKCKNIKIIDRRDADLQD